MTALLPALALLAAAAAAPGDPPPRSRVLVSIASQGGGLGFVDNQVIVVSRVSNPAGGGEVWIAERRRDNQRMRERIVDHQWIDGRRCPALLTALEAMARLPAARFGAPGKAAEAGMAFDVPMTTVRGQPAEADGVGVALIRSEYTGPFATWRLQTERAIEACWRDAPVVVPGAQVIPHLATSLDLQGWGR